MLSESAISAAAATSALRSVGPSASSGSGSHGPAYLSRRARADRSWSMASRVVMVARYAFGDSMGRWPAWASRRNASDTTSSASLTLPSIR